MSSYTDFLRVAQAKTGTGKTLAFLLPMLQRMIDQDPSLADRNARRRARPDDIRGIVISPTRELAEQIAVEAKKLVSNTGLVVQTAVGGSQKRQMLSDMRRRGCHLLVATPGRLLDLLSDPGSGIAAPNLDALVLDEADRMLDVGFAPTLEDIQSHLPDIREQVRQTMLFSATIPSNVVKLAKAMVRPDQFEFVQTIKADEAPTHARVPQHISITRSLINLFPSLYELMDREKAKAAAGESRPFKAIIYFSTTAMVELAMGLDESLRRSRGVGRNEYPTWSIHGKLTQGQRTRAAESFRRCRSGVLISSDVTARGMDFPDVTHVIQVGLPRDREQYIHRLGRTARQDKEGTGWLILPEFEAGEAASMLSGLGLKDNRSIEAAEVRIESEEDMPEIAQEVADGFAAMPMSTLVAAYMGIVGTMSAKTARASVPHLNKWATIGWKKQTPPSVSSVWASKVGLAGVPGLNISDGRPRRDRSFSRDRESSGDSFEDAFQSRVGLDGSSGGDRFRGGRGGGGFQRGGRDGGRDGGFRRGGRPGFNRGGDRGDFGGDRF